jgi:hypothetical protein
MICKRFLSHSSFALAAVLFTASVAMSASNITNSLTGFTGNSGQPATQAAVAAAGFNFSDVGNPVTQVSFDATGASFGVGQPNNDGRNYMRTVDMDYSNVSFVAEVTIVTPNIDVQDAYFGLGSGFANPDFFRTPDFASQFASIMYWGENEIATPTVEVVTNNDGIGDSDSLTAAAGLGDGTHRVRIAYDWFQKKATFSYDLNYAGGAFTADVTSPIANTLPLYATGTGFTTDPGRIFFGGDEGVTFKDFQVVVSTTPVVFGDLNSSGTITGADWAILRANLYADQGGSFSDAYFKGDLTADLKTDHDDFVVFKTVFDAVNGAGSFAQMLASVPEPMSLLLFLSAGVMMLFARRRTAHCR